MLILLIGIVVFLGVHSLTTLRETRTRLIEWLGPGPFKGLYSLVAIAGFVLIVWGFSRGKPTQDVKRPAPYFSASRARR